MNNLFDLSGKAAMVTGASSGLGVQFAQVLARQGADVAILARRVERIEELKGEIEKLGVRCLALKCDVTQADQLKDAIGKIKDFYGRIDILVNNAGVAGSSPAESQTDEQWRSIIDLNLNAVYFCAREVGKIMIGQKYGKIINIGSIHSSVAMPGSTLSGYCASKGGVLMLTKALANEWAKYNITVNAIGPAYFASEMTQHVFEKEGFLKTVQTYCPMGRPGRPGELDGALIYFASDASSYTTGQLLSVDGGWTAI
ncbi:MAG: SDR family oxidoreductase [Treponema sp.]|jgi:gluconate 5-dehydrogenase|nr:SDR family oxidoreductase [Treponema sp.]